MITDKMDTASVHRLHRMHQFPIISIAPLLFILRSQSVRA